VLGPEVAPDSPEIVRSPGDEIVKKVNHRAVLGDSIPRDCIVAAGVGDETPLAGAAADYCALQE
jgi:hypothetical protein